MSFVCVSAIRGFAASRRISLELWAVAKGAMFCGGRTRFLFMISECMSAVRGLARFSRVSRKRWALASYTMGDLVRWVGTIGIGH